MTNQTQAGSRKIPMGQKVAFGLGMLANQMFPAVMGIFMVVLVQDLGFPGWMWGVIFFLPRVFDSITDPIMGFISDNTKSRWGRRRQYVFFGALMMGISFIILWQLYRENSISYNFTYFLCWSFVFYLGLTIFSVPYVAMGYEMSDDFHERTSLMAVSQWIGQWAWVIAPWFWVIMYDPDWFPSADVATRTLATWVGIIFMLCAMVPAIFVKSESTLHEDYAPMNLKTIGGSLKKIATGFKEAFQLKPFRKMCIATFLIFNSFNTVATFTFFIIVYYLFAGDAGAAGVWPTLFGSVGALMTTFLVIPIVARMSKLYGKKRAFLISQSISIVGYILLWFLLIPGKPFMFLFALPFFAFGIGSLFTIMMSMTADVMDLDELHSGQRREGIFGAIYWWMVKFGFAIAGLASGAILSLIGFNAAAEVQTDEAILGLRLFFSGLPILATSVAMIIMKDYDITEEKANKISAQLKQRKSKPSLTSSFYQENKLLELIGREQFEQLHSDGEKRQIPRAQLLSDFNQTLNNGVHGLCFGAHTEGQSKDDVISVEQIERRINIIQPHTRWVRSFSCTQGHENIPKIAKDKGLKTVVGAWIGKDQERNERELNSLIGLCRQDVVDLAVIGNEVLLRGDASVNQLVEYINKVKKATPSVPVSYVDAYYQFGIHPELTSACDVIMANCYPFWEGYSVNIAPLVLNQMYQLVRNASQGKKVIISETGWPVGGESLNQAEPSSENSMQYFISIQDWARTHSVDLFYFSSFDETWKEDEEGKVGGQWGIWDKNENLKHQ
jgi:GPH family glycoside/pentoside/hexuronide:cation symporter